MKEQLIDEPVERKYEKAFYQASGANPIFAYAAKQQMGKMIEVIARADENFAYRLNTNQDFYKKGGFIAEEFHAETFNLDSVLNDSDARAITDRYKQEWTDQGLKGNDNPDIVIVKNGEITIKAQSKYNQTAQKTSGQMSQKNNDGTTKYGDMDQMIAPSDQVGGVKDHANDIANKKAELGDAALEKSHRNTAEKVTDKITDGESSSTPLSKSEANEMGKGNLDKKIQIENEYKTASTVKQMGNAAVNAAAMSAVVAGSINTVRYIQLAREGKLSAEEATFEIVKESVSAAADSAVKASANAGVQSLMVRYGSEKAVVEVLAKQGLQSMMKTNAVTVGVVCAVDAVKDLVRLGMGDISQEEFFERQGKGLMMTSAGVVGGSLGAAGVTAIAGALGVGSGTLAMTAAGVLGGLSGGMIAGIAMTIAIENGIEKPYRDLVQNTTSLREAAHTLEQVSQTVLMGQLFFAKYIEDSIHLERQINAQFDRIDSAGSDALSAIMKI